jgi:nitrite reductase (NADH) large subunit
MKTHIVIGASAAGIGALIGLRQNDTESNIICISEQDSLPYNKCLLADFICQRIETDRLFSKDKNFFEKNKIQLMLSKKVEKILPDKNQIVLEDIPFESSQILTYDTLFLGLGTSAFIPQIELKKNNFFTFHTLMDARKILNFIKENRVKNATIIGSGLSGVELADAFTSINIKVNLIERGDRVLAFQVDDKGSEIIENELLKNKINLYKKTSVQEIEEQVLSDKKIFILKLSCGEEIKTEMVVFAVGSKPNTEIAKSAGINLEKNQIVTNEKMQTNIANVYAGGDACLVKDIVLGQLVPSCTWPDATMQGMIAGTNMAGAAQLYPGVLTTISSKIFDLQFVNCGHTVNVPNTAKVDTKIGENFYHKFVTLDSKLIGFLMVGNLQDVGKLKSKIIKKEAF